MISNTATPKYYGQFREAVLSGEMPVCQTISMEMCRIDRLIANPTVWYDPAPVEGYVKYCERELTLTDGDDLVLLPSFKLWAEQIFGWYYFEPGPVFIKGKDGEPGRYVTKNIRRRLIHKQYLIVGRRASNFEKSPGGSADILVLSLGLFRWGSLTLKLHCLARFVSLSLVGISSV